MTTKLTLSVDKQVVQRAKRFARNQKQSLSQIVSRYLEYISSEELSAEEIDPEVLQLSDRIPLKDLADLKDSKFQYLMKKYVHE
jgi:hypothetical protein